MLDDAKLKVEVERVLLASEYALVVKKTAEGVEVHYPTGDTQRWTTTPYAGGLVAVQEEVAEELFIVPDYAAPAVLIGVIEQNALKIDYDPSYIFYVDEDGAEQDVTKVIDVSADVAERYSDLIDVLEESKVVPNPEYLEALARRKGVLEGFRAVATIVASDQKEQN